VGVAYSTTLLLYVQANKLTTAANAIFLQSTAPLYLLLVGPLLLREPVRRSDLYFMGALGAGLVLFFVGAEAPQRTAPDPVLGNVLALCSAVTWALTVAGLRWLARSEGQAGEHSTAAGAALVGNALVFLAAAPLAFPVGETPPQAWAYVTYLGVFQIALAYIFMTRGVRRIPALEGSLLLLVEPVLNTLWAWLLHGELPGAWSAAGASVILVATAVHAVAASRRPK
jgi:drug/metabolite transporter (DMT)-like permease